MKKYFGRLLVVVVLLLLALTIALLFFKQSTNDSLNAKLPWNLILVNREHAVPDKFHAKMHILANRQQVDERIYPALQAMFDAARNNELQPEAAYCYRLREQQREIYQNRVAYYQAQGLSKKEAETQTARYIAKPVHSEHQLGLAIDIRSKNVADSDVLYTWLENNAHLYGFIQRYPKDKTDITGFNYERWHYRYVGIEEAKVIFDEHLTLEEYLQKYR